jgi:hypothetical protein
MKDCAKEKKFEKKGFYVPNIFKNNTAVYTAGA